jgi:hypothetical protein
MQPVKSQNWTRIRSLLVVCLVGREEAVVHLQEAVALTRLMPPAARPTPRLMIGFLALTVAGDLQQQLLSGIFQSVRISETDLLGQVQAQGR